jgi:hypothetical protein
MARQHPQAAYKQQYSKLVAMSSTNKKRKTAETLESLDAVNMETILLETMKKLVDTEERAKTAEARVKELEEKLKSTEENEEEEEEEDDEESSLDGNDPWNIKFQELREYRILNSDCKVPQQEEGLGKWVQNQRFLKTKSKLSKERIARLDSIGFYWGKGTPEPESWDTKFEELAKYQKHMGHCNINIDPRSPSELAKWVTAQRAEYKYFRKCRASLLSTEQVGRLKKIGFQWKGPSSPAASSSPPAEPQPAPKSRSVRALQDYNNRGRKENLVLGPRMTRSQRTKIH